MRTGEFTTIVVTPILDHDATREEWNNGDMMNPVKIPLIDVRADGPAILSQSNAAGAERLLKAGKKMMSPPVVALFNWRSKRWAARTNNPYLAEIDAAAAPLPYGVWLMNFCYEWGCTTGVGAAPQGGMVMRRTLDWPFHGLGRELVVAHQQGQAGDFYNLTWPGFVGVITGMAPGRFAIAINQAPLRQRRNFPAPINWFLDRLAVQESRHLPPAHVVRQVFETCKDFDAAVEMLASTPIAMPALISIAGVKEGEGCILEHLGTEVRRHDGLQAVANDWITPEADGDKARGKENAQRRGDMLHFCEIAGEDQDVFDWVTPPIHNKDTRLASVMNPATGALHLVGYEVDGPATEVFSLSAG